MGNREGIQHIIQPSCLIGSQITPSKDPDTTRVW